MGTSPMPRGDRASLSQRPDTRNRAAYRQTIPVEGEQIDDLDSDATPGFPDDLPPSYEASTGSTAAGTTSHSHSHSHSNSHSRLSPRRSTTTTTPIELDPASPFCDSIPLESLHRDAENERLLVNCTINRQGTSSGPADLEVGYTRNQDMDVDMTKWNDFEQSGHWRDYESAAGACCGSRSGGCCFSSRGACCFSDREGCFCSDRQGCCFSDRGACCCSVDEACCFSRDSACCCSEDQGCCFSDGDNCFFVKSEKGRRASMHKYEGAFACIPSTGTFASYFKQWTKRR